MRYAKTMVRMLGMGLLLFLWLIFPVTAQEQKKLQQQDIQAVRDKALLEAMQDMGLVTLVKKNAPLAEVVDELRKQVKINLVLDPRNVTEQDKVTLELREVPFRTVLDTFLELAGLVIEEETPYVIRIAKPQRISIEFKEAPLVEVLSIIGKLSGANIIVSNRVSGTIKLLTMKDTPWTEVLNTVVKTAGYATVREKFNIVRVVAFDELRSQMETRVFQLKYLEPPPIYRAKIEPNKYFVGGPQGAGAAGAGGATAGAAGATGGVVDPRAASFTLLNILRVMLTKDAAGKAIGSLEYDIGQNAVVVTDTKPVLDQIDAMLAKLDVEPELILVDVQVLSTTNESLLTFGMSYSSFNPVTGSTESGITGGTKPVAPNLTASPTASTAQVFSSLPFGFGGTGGVSQYFLTTYDVQAILRIFKKDSFTRLEQKPSIVVSDNTEATIFVGESVPYAELQVTPATPPTPPTTTISEGAHSPVKVGFQLLVIPHVVKGTDQVMLTLIPQNEFLSGRSPLATVAGFEHFVLGGLTIDLPRIAQTTAVTKLVMKSGMTAVLGGLYTDHTTIAEEKVPLLGDIPVLGFLFKQKSDTISRNNLIIFVTPRILGGHQATRERLQQWQKQRSEQEQRQMEEYKKQMGASESLQKMLEEREKKAAEELKQK